MSCHLIVRVLRVVVEVHALSIVPNADSGVEKAVFLRSWLLEEEFDGSETDFSVEGCIEAECLVASATDLVYFGKEVGFRQLDHSKEVNITLVIRRATFFLLGALV
jgi:hypothetical protein